MEFVGIHRQAYVFTQGRGAVFSAGSCPYLKKVTCFSDVWILMASLNSVTYVTASYFNLPSQRHAMKPSRASDHVKMELVSDISETVFASSFRVFFDQ